MGKELVYRYAQRGCNLVIGARRLPELEKIKNECLGRFKNSKIVCVKVDVSVEEEAKTLVETAASNFGRIDILVLCAGISAHSLFEDFQDMAPFRKVVETNLYGCVYPVRHALKHMKKEK